MTVILDAPLKFRSDQEIDASGETHGGRTLRERVQPWLTLAARLLLLPFTVALALGRVAIVLAVVLGLMLLVALIVSLNLKRRHLTAGQKAMIGLKAKPLLEQEARERQAATLKRGDKTPSLPMGTHGRSAAFAAAAVGVSEQTVNRAQAVAKHGVPELAASAVNVSARSVENKSCAPAVTEPPPAAGVVRYEDAAPPVRTFEAFFSLDHTSRDPGGAAHPRKAQTTGRGFCGRH